MRPDFELFAAFLVDMGGPVHGEALDAGGERNGSPHLRAGALGRVDDFPRRIVEDPVIEGFKPDADILTLHSLLSVMARLVRAIHLLSLDPRFRGDDRYAVTSRSSRRRRRRRCGRLRGWRSAASLPWRSERSARLRRKHCRPASPFPYPPAA